MTARSRRWARAAACAAALLAAGSGQAGSGQADVGAAGPLRATIDARRTAAAVTPYEYGMFIEPIGGLIARSLWAEMLDDRKFYYPVVPEGKDPPLPTGVEGRPGFGYRKWRPLGSDDAVRMDERDPYVGAHGPRITLDPGQRRGIGQSGIALAGGREYSGYVVYQAPAGARVQATLAWGPGPDQRQSLELPGATAGWQRAPVRFRAGAESADARFEITATGNGDLRIGTASLMPADNIDGWRADTTALLRGLHSGFWRLPGGNFLSNWDWHGALGPRDLRAPMFDRAWAAMQPNDLGMDEYMQLARLLGVEPYVTVNAGLGDANSAAEEVEYLNGPASSPWGARRAANGHPAPYGVKYWNIGNEPYGWWQIGQTTLAYFMMKQADFAAAMRAADPGITLIASGAMPDQMHGRDVHENPALADILARFGTDQDWTGGLLEHAWGTFDGISEHWYDRAEERPGAPPDEELTEFARAPSNHVRMKADEWAVYQQRYPAMRERGVFLSIDEYAYFSGSFGAPPTLKQALAYCMVLQEMLRHTDFLSMSAFTTGASTLDITPNASTLNAIGEVYALYGDHFGAGVVPVALEGNSPQPAPRHPVGTDHPQARAGSPTYPLDVVAALAPDRRHLRIAVVNPTLHAQRLAVTLAGFRASGPGVAWRLGDGDLAAVNRVGQPPRVQVLEQRVRPLARGLEVPAASAVIYEFSGAAD